MNFRTEIGSFERLKQAKNFEIFKNFRKFQFYDELTLGFIKITLTEGARSTDFKIESANIYHSSRIRPPQNQKASKTCFEANLFSFVGMLSKLNVSCLTPTDVLIWC